MAGWIKIYRDITNHWIFQDAERFKWWIDLLIMASHEDHKTLSNGSLVSLKRGQLSVSLSFLSGRWGRSKEKVLNFLRLLESDGMIQRISDRKSTTITICNYDSYQDSLEQTPTANPTDVRPMSDQCPTEYKNVKNVEEINNTNTAHAREGEVVWIASVEQGFAETFKAQGSAIPFARKTGKKPQEVLELLDIYLAMRQLKNKGHRDFNQFVNLFLWSVENNKISIPTEAKKKEPKVISGSDIFNVYGKS